ncbi:MAG: hypothetical protein JWM21_4378 [Acidobacteria bacterium]|nr:hypothetical protein [Acidobacteriota bacterium]
MNLRQPFVRSLLLLALLFTLLNAFKPLCIDDALYYYHAEQLAFHPLEPYRFRIFWNDRPEPAVQNLAPVMMPYWWAIALRLVGDRPFLWKLWLLPYALILVFSLHALLRRFVADFELTLTWMIIISPVFLPSFNLMLDVPVAALILCSIAVFLRAADQNSLPLATMAGLMGGIAAQTKYNGLVVVPVILLYAILARKLRLGIVAAFAVALTFLSWEGFIFWRAGRSHFLAQSHVYGSVNLMAKYIYLAWPLVTITGAVGPATTVLALVVLRASKRTIVIVGAVLCLGYFLIAFIPGSYQVLARDARTGEPRLTLAWLIFSVYGVFFGTVFGAVLWRLTRLSKGVATLIRRRKRFQAELFLAGWLLIEIVAYFGFSPIPAVRRFLGLLVVTTLIIGRLAVRTCRTPQRRSLVRRVAFAGMPLALLFYAVDFHDAQVEKTAAETAAKTISEFDRHSPNTHPTTWYVARWGFQFYAERAGMKPIYPDESKFQPGDWLALSDGPANTKAVTEHISHYRLEPVTTLEFGDRLPLGTMLGYYSTGIPIHHQEGPRRVVKIYRVAEK